MPVFHVTVRGKEYRVEVPNPRERPVRAIVEGEVIEVNVETQPTKAVPSPSEPKPRPSVAPTRPSAQTQTTSPGKVTAPLPGVIVSIAVSEGAQVERGQELCIIEAMKMNNPIRATKAGTVAEVLINVGQQVQHGTVLFIIEV